MTDIDRKGHTFGVLFVFVLGAILGGGIVAINYCDAAVHRGYGYYCHGYEAPASFRWSGESCHD